MGKRRLSTLYSPWVIFLCYVRNLLNAVVEKLRRSSQKKINVHCCDVDMILMCVVSFCCCFAALLDWGNPRLSASQGHCPFKQRTHTHTSDSDFRERKI